jgi:hypothetical protein
MVTPAAAWCLVMLGTAACGAGTSAASHPPRAPHVPTVSNTEAAVPLAQSADADPADPAPPVMRVGQAGSWERVLGRLDRIRSRAFEQLRPALLCRVYVSGSALLRHERAVLGGYRDRGVGLRGVRLHRTKVRVLSASRRQVTLRVVERLGPTTAVVGSRRVRLPVDAPTSRVLHLAREEGGWRIAGARRLSG